MGDPVQLPAAHRPDRRACRLGKACSRRPRAQESARFAWTEPRFMPRTGRTRWADLQPLVGTLTARLANHDTNSAENPQPPARYRK
jgi:hypothetical protein